jgi:hypothetical protein
VKTAGKTGSSFVSMQYSVTLRTIMYVGEVA